MVRVEGMTMPGNARRPSHALAEQEGRRLVLGAWRHPMLMVGTDSVVVEARLLTVELGCPSCGEVLRPWGQVGEMEMVAERLKSADRL